MRGAGLGAGDERPSAPDSNLKGPADTGVDIPLEGGEDPGPSEECQPGGASTVPWQGEPLKIRLERGR